MRHSKTLRAKLARNEILTLLKKKKLSITQRKVFLYKA